MSGDADPGAKRHAPATLRNRDAIADVLRRILPETGRVLEVASGSGEHLVHFAALFPALEWQPSDPDPASRASIAAWTAEAGLPNIAPPLDLDAAAKDWPVAAADAILCINMIHISPWAATEGLLAGAGRVLDPGAPLYLYGPFRMGGRPTAPSNEAFDRSLKSRNPAWGVRDIADVEKSAERAGLGLEEIVDMPANNVSAILRRRQAR
ncbi:DUF938 domain-containing protein [Parasphingopyxis algicola]|uniref:DUF938 domain-containing protein n=1 Tax=Parasphingopyxis algicola TaxID=2026624 RepID=UPI0015A12B58|nr:DUF938 domain-containing protein [Parasphingopyxis algicola]QLC24490.1 DUF938 domain-containing protein [Parasphingopyxis algicola]